MMIRSSWNHGPRPNDDQTLFPVFLCYFSYRFTRIFIHLRIHILSRMSAFRTVLPAKFSSGFLTNANFICKRAVLSFGDVGEYACGPWGRRSVDIAIFGAQLGFCCAYFGFVGENLHSVIYSYFDCYNVDQKLIMVLMSM